MIAADDNMGRGTFRAADLLLPARGPGVTLVGARQRRAALELEPDRCGGRHAGQDVNLVATATLRLRRGLDPNSRFRRMEMCSSGATVGAGCSAGRRAVVPGRERRLRRSLQCNSLASAEGVSRGRWIPILSVGLSRNEGSPPQMPQIGTGPNELPLCRGFGPERTSCPRSIKRSATATARPYVRWPRRRPPPRRGPPSTA